jgi:F-type H+-transporting ATPase subunit b
MELLKLLSVNEIVAQIISFLIMFFLLRAFAWKPLLKLLDARKARIAAEFKAIEDSKQGIAELQSQYQKKLDGADSEAQLMIKEAVRQGQKLSEELTRVAHQDAQKIIDSARADIKYELAKAKEELKDQIIDLTINAAETVIEDKLTEAEDRKIVRDFLDKMDTIE